MKWLLILLFVSLQSFAKTYEVSINPSEVYDGDTIQKVTFDLGFNIYTKKTLRLKGIDTPEIRTKDLDEKKRGYIARDWLRERIKGKAVTVHLSGTGKFGRWIATLKINGVNINKQMLKLGLAEVYEK